MSCAESLLCAAIWLALEQRRIPGRGDLFDLAYAVLCSAVFP